MAFNPSKHIPLSKSLATINFPIVAQSYFYDESLFVYRPYVSEAEVTDYIGAEFRKGSYDIVINIGGLLADGVITGGQNKLYWFDNDGTLKPKGGSDSAGGTPTSGTLLSSDSPLVITWDTDLVPDDEEGRTYLEKHGPLEKVSIQVTMPDPANDGDNTFFPSWRFDEATKNTLTIDNQGQKLYYVIGFGADGSSSGGGSAPDFVFNEVPSGAINGSNATYSASNSFIPESLVVIVNGITMKPTDDYVNINTIQFELTFSPEAGEHILINYIKA